MRPQKHAQGEFCPQDFIMYLAVGAVVFNHQTSDLGAQVSVMCNKPS